MATDPLVAEVRQVREAYAERFNYDVHAMWRDLKERQEKSGRNGMTPKRLDPAAGREVETT